MTRALGKVKDVGVELSVELGRTVRSVSEVATIGEGTIIKLESLCGEPVELRAAGKLIARGEVVVIDENFGLRVSEVVAEEH